MGQVSASQQTDTIWFICSRLLMLVSGEERTTVSCCFARHTWESDTAFVAEREFCDVLWLCVTLCNNHWRLSGQNILTPMKKYIFSFLQILRIVDCFSMLSGSPKSKWTKGGPLVNSEYSLTVNNICYVAMVKKVSRNAVDDARAISVKHWCWCSVARINLSSAVSSVR